MTYKCRECGTLLTVGENVTQNMIDHSQYACRICRAKQCREWYKSHPGSEYQRDWHREYNHRTGRHQPMNENKRCSSFLGVHVAERVLSHVFKDVQKMPYGNIGFDFICGGGYKIDVKSACRQHSEKCRDHWQFKIRKNQIAEYFLCLAFDNREDLNPEHIWLIPAEGINGRSLVGIAETRISKWDKYKLDMTKVVACCNMIKED